MSISSSVRKTNTLRLLCLLVCAFAILSVPFSTPAMTQGASDAWYETEVINQGLPVGPDDRIDRTAPRQTLRGFLNATEQGNFDAAAHYLNLADVPQDIQEERGPETAQKLSSILARQVWINWRSLPARPDAMIEHSSDSSARAGQPRRNLVIASLETGQSAYDIRLARYKSADQPAIWLFTPQTVDNVDVLFAEFGPRRYESRIPASLKREIAGLWLWEWIALPALCIALLFAGSMTRSATLWLASKSDRTWLRKGLDRSGLPLAILIMAGLAQLVFSNVLSFSGPVQMILRPVLIILMVWGVGMTALRLLDAALHRITIRYVGEIDDKRGVDERELYTSIYALRRLIVLLMVGLAVIVVLARLNLFESVGLTLLASAGVLTVVFGIAGQAVLGNILASLQIAFAKPVRIGDSVFFEGDWSYVEAVFYTFLRLRTWDHRRIVVPVTYFVSKPFENWSVAEARMMKVIDLRLDPCADVDELRDCFEKLVKDDPEISESDSANTRTTDQSADGLNVSFYAMMDDPSTGWTVQCRLREQLMAHIRDNRPNWLPRERVEDVHARNNPDRRDPQSAGTVRMAGSG